jgi:hypothetical protein
MKGKITALWVAALTLALCAVGLRPAGASAADDDTAKLLKALPQSKLSLAKGIQQATMKSPQPSPQLAISAKFELDGGKLSLSVYTVEIRSDADAKHDVFKELSGSPEGDKWSPEVEVFKDVPHAARASQQLTLMSLTKLSLLDIIKKAEKDRPGTVFSVVPALHEHRGVFEVLVAAEGKVVELHYDLTTGDRLPQK